VATPLINPARIAVRRRVEWRDTDAAGIAHYTTAFSLAEAAEAALYTSLGADQRMFGATPRVKATAEFRRSFAFNDLLEIAVTVASIGRSSLVYRFEITKEDEICAEGEVTTCLIDPATARATPWPDDLRTMLGSAGAQTEA
jgi:YbgC/YbaW family acyl-CoA thioester hydrolase